MKQELGSIHPKNLRKGFPLHSYPKDGIGTLNPFLGKGLDSQGPVIQSDLFIPYCSWRSLDLTFEGVT